MYYRFKNTSEQAELEKELTNLGFVKSEYCGENPVGIATFVGVGGYVRIYILCNETMMNTTNERTSWVMHRKKAETPAEMLWKIKEYLKSIG